MEIMKVKGSLNKGFTGGITYITLIPDDFEELNVTLSFGMREVKVIDKTLVEDIQVSWQANYPEPADDETIKEIIARQKGEINFSLFMNDQFIGAAHRDDTNKIVKITKTDASLGFQPYHGRRGIIKIILNVISVVNDNTPYELKVEVA